MLVECICWLSVCCQADTHAHVLVQDKNNVCCVVCVKLLQTRLERAGAATFVSLLELTSRDT